MEDDSAVRFMYAFMHCWSNATDRWISGRPDHEPFRGEFREDNSFSLREDVLWLAVFSEKEGVGGVLRYPEVYRGDPNTSNMFWNLPIDNKHYFRAKLPRWIGETFAYQAVIACFEAGGENCGGENWEERAQERLADLADRDIPGE